MDHKQVVEKLNSLEGEFPVNEWLIDDIYVWPLVKYYIFKKWRDINQQEQGQLKKTTPNHSKTSIFKTATEFLTSFYHVAAFRAASAKKIPILFTGFNAHRVDFEGAYTNRYFEPVIDYLKNEFNSQSVIVEYRDEDHTKVYKSRESIIFLTDFLPFFKMINRSRFKTMKLKLHGFDLFLKRAGEEFAFVDEKSFSTNAIKASVKRIKTIASAYDLILDKYKPKYLMGLCYYNDQVFAADYAASKRSIISIDMQHGGQGKLHIAYGNYGSVPARGYNLLPDIFWCWDEASYNAVNTWVVKQEFHKVIMGGNPWLSYFLKNNTDSYPFPEKKLILYTMQLDVPERYIIDAIKQTSDKFEWWFRFHPRTSAAMRQTVIDLFNNSGLTDKVNISDASSYPLPLILSNTAVHISKFSGSIIEATQLGISTILIDPTGIENFNDYIKSGEAVPFLEGTADGLLNLIKQLSRDTDGKNLKNLDNYKQVINNLMIANE